MHVILYKIIMMLEGHSREDANASPLDNFKEFTKFYIRKK